MKWTSLNDLRESFLDFYEKQGHLRHASFPLIPQNDKSLLLINAGMAPLKKYFTGEEEPPRHRMTTCQKCHGSGQVVTQQRSMFGIMQSVSVCPDCGGTGEVIKDKCPHCNGKGTVRGEEIVTVNIPAGVENGMQLSMRGKGNAAPNGGVNGDLIVLVEEIDHPIFERDGNNLYINYYISFPQAALGDTVQIPILNGFAKVKIAPGTQSGQMLRLQRNSTAGLWATLS